MIHALALLLLLLATPAWAAVAFDTFIAGAGTTVSCPNRTLTVGAGSNRALIVLVVLQNPNTAVVSSITGAGATWAGAADGTRANTTNERLEIWHGTNPTTGSQTVTTTITGTLSGECWPVVMSFNGVDQTTPVSGYVSSIATASLAVTTVSGDAIAAQQGHCCTAVGVPSNCTTTNDSTFASNINNEATHCLASGTTTTVTYANADTLTINAIAVKQVSAGAVTPSRTLTGAGS